MIRADSKQSLIKHDKEQKMRKYFKKRTNSIEKFFVQKNQEQNQTNPECKKGKITQILKIISHNKQNKIKICLNLSSIQQNKQKPKIPLKENFNIPLKAQDINIQKQQNDQQINKFEIKLDLKESLIQDNQFHCDENFSDNKENIDNLKNQDYKKNITFTQVIQSKKFNKKLFNEDSDMKTAKKPKRDYQQEILDFEKNVKDNTQELILQNMFQKEIKYRLNNAYIHYFNQRNITKLMRSILFDWMMEVCAEFQLKRETLYLSFFYVDKYLSLVQNIPSDQLQLIGLTSMYVACKMEEVIPIRTSDFIKSADNLYDDVQIMNMEQELCQRFQYSLNPVTPNAYIQWYMQQWDNFMPQQDGEQIYFKQPNLNSYKNYREVYQIMDCLMIEFQTLKYNKLHLIAAIFYLILGKNLNCFTQFQISQEFTSNSSFLNDNEQFNLIFSQYLKTCFAFDIMDILPHIQYISSFFIIELNFDVPKSLLQNQDGSQNNLEEFLTYQTSNPNVLNVIQNREKIQNF